MGFLRYKDHLEKFDQSILGTITVVSGLPRSGTSMMMQMLEAGGLEIFTDKGVFRNSLTTLESFEFEVDIVSTICDGLVLLMHMDNESIYGENSTLVRDFSGVNNHGTFNGELNVTTGAFKNGFAFNKTIEKYVEIPHDSSFSMDQGTIVLWLNPKNYTILGADHYGLFSKDSEDKDTGGHITMAMGRFETADSHKELVVRLEDINDDYYLMSDTEVPLNYWTHFATTFGSEGMKLYQNGSLITSNSYAGGITMNNNSIAIGASTYTSGNFLNSFKKITFALSKKS